MFARFLSPVENHPIAGPRGGNLEITDFKIYSLLCLLFAFGMSLYLLQKYKMNTICANYIESMEHDGGQLPLFQLRGGGKLCPLWFFEKCEKLRLYEIPDYATFSYTLVFLINNCRGAY